MNSSSAFYVVVLTAVLVCLYQLLKRYTWILQIPSHMIRLPRNTTGDMADIVERPRTFGISMVKASGPLYLLWMGLQPVMALADSITCEEFYTRIRYPPRPPALGLGNLFSRFLGSCLGCLDGHRWTMVMKAFKPAFLRMHTSETNREAIQQLIANWVRDTLEPAAADHLSRYPWELVGDLTQDISQSVLFGQEFATRYRDEFLRLSKVSQFLVNQSFLNSKAKFVWYQFLPTEVNKTLVSFYEDLANLVEKYDQENIPSGELKNIGRENVTQEEFLQTLAEIVFSNQYVLIPTTSWLFVHYALYANELRDADDDKIGHFINESARCAPVFPYSMQQLSDKDVFGLPKGAAFCLDMLSLNRNGSVWPAPDQFNPDRFKQDIGEHVFPRFGLGTRKCPGRHLANVMLREILTACTSKYAFSFEDNSIKHHDDIPLKPGVAFLIPAAKVRITWKPILH